VRLGETASGTAAALSPDAKWALTIRSGPSPQLVLLPTGAGEARVVEEKHVTPFGALGWLPDGKRIVFSGAATGQGPRLYLRDLDESARAIAPEGAGVNGDYCVSPDGRLLAASQADQELWLYPLNGGEARRAPGTAAGDIPARFTADGRALFVFRRQGFPIPVDRLDLETGKRVRWKDLAPVDPAGAGLYYNRVLLTPDGSSYYYDYTLLLSELQWVDGLK
jgi:Tol biopolymer transport system component